MKDPALAAFDAPGRVEGRRKLAAPSDNLKVDLLRTIRSLWRRGDFTDLTGRAVCAADFAADPSKSC
jgi:hypothetical protein